MDATYAGFFTFAHGRRLPPLTKDLSGIQGVFTGGDPLRSLSGRESLDTGRFYADTNGSIARQTIKLCPGMVGAVACNNVPLLQSLPLEELLVKDGFGRSAAMLAALFNSWAVLQHLLKLPDSVDWSETQSAQVGYHGKTVMHYLCSNPPTAAAAYQHAEAVNMLPDTLPATVLNAQDEQGLTPLVLAVKSRNMTLLQWLLSHGADANVVGGALAAPTCVTGHAVQLKDARYLEQLLAFGASVHFHDVLGRTPLHHALDLKHSEHLQLLVLYGANLDARHIDFRQARYAQTIRQVINDLPVDMSGAALKTAMAQGIAARRRLVVLTLGARVVPALSPDVLHLICQYASLTH